MTTNLAASGQLPTYVWVPVLVVMTALSLWFQILRYQQRKRDKIKNDAKEERLQAYLSERDEQWKREHGGHF